MFWRKDKFKDSFSGQALVVVWRGFLDFLKKKKFNPWHFSVLLLVAFFLYIFFWLYLGPPRYTARETRANEKYFFQMLEESGGPAADCIAHSVRELRKYQHFYNMIINNMKAVDYVDGSGCGKVNSFAARGNTLLVNNRVVANLKATCPPGDISSTLIHEGNHMEYFNSSKWRQRYLAIECSPFLNTDISIYTGYDLEHALKSVEICAEREQYNYACLEDPGHEDVYGHGVLYYFFMNMKDVVKKIW